MQRLSGTAWLLLPPSGALQKEGFFFSLFFYHLGLPSPQSCVSQLWRVHFVSWLTGIAKPPVKRERGGGGRVCLMNRKWVQGRLDRDELMSHCDSSLGKWSWKEPGRNCLRPLKMAASIFPSAFFWTDLALVKTGENSWMRGEMSPRIHKSNSWALLITVTWMNGRLLRLQQLNW